MSRVDLIAYDFCSGIMMGLQKLGMKDVDVLSPDGQEAARDTFEYLREMEADQFDFRFRIILHRIYGDSNDWSQAVDWQRSLGYVAIRDGVYVSIISNDLVDMLLERLPGGTQLWLDCARWFYDRYTSPALKPRQATV